MFSLRRFTSLCISFSFLVMTYTGIVLFIAPKGRVANWTNWKFLGLDKTEYTNLHVTFMVLFTIGMILHIYLNWKPLMSYLKNKARQFSILTKEFGLAFGFNLLFLFGTLYYWAPFDQFLDFEESVKVSWEKNVSKAPYGHAELSTLEEFSKKMGLDINTVLSDLKAANLKGIESGKTIDKIAKENGKTPAQIFESIKSKPTTAIKEGSGMGKISLKDAADKNSFSLENAIATLKAKEIEANGETTLKDIADKLKIKPTEVVELLKTSTQKETK